MCKFCENFDFSRVGVDYDCFGARIKPHVYHAGGNNVAPDEQRFLFCPICGKRIPSEHESMPDDNPELWGNYILSEERAEILGSGSDYTEIARCRTWEEARSALASHPCVNHITRSAKNGRRQWYDFTKKMFRDY